MASLSLLISPGTGVMVVGLVRLFGDGDVVTARAGHWPSRLYLLCAGTAQSIPLPDPLVLALLPKKSPAVTLCSSVRVTSLCNQL